MALPKLSELVADQAFTSLAPEQKDKITTKWILAKSKEGRDQLGDDWRPNDLVEGVRNSGLIPESGSFAQQGSGSFAERIPGEVFDAGVNVAQDVAGGVSGQVENIATTAEAVTGFGEGVAEATQKFNKIIGFDDRQQELSGKNVSDVFSLDFDKVAGGIEAFQSGLANTAASLIPMILATGIAGPGAGFATSLLLNTSESVKGLKDDGKSDAEALTKGGLAGVGKSALDTFGLNKILKNFKGPIAENLKGRLGAALTEGGTEIAQEVIDNMARISQDESLIDGITKMTADEAFNIFAPSFVLGGAVSATRGDEALPPPPPETETTQPEGIEDVITPTEQGTEILQEDGSPDGGDIGSGVEGAGVVEPTITGSTAEELDTGETTSLEADTVDTGRDNGVDQGSGEGDADGGIQHTSNTRNAATTEKFLNQQETRNEQGKAKVKTKEEKVVIDEVESNQAFKEIQEVGNTEQKPSSDPEVPLHIAINNKFVAKARKRLGLPERERPLKKALGKSWIDTLWRIGGDEKAPERLMDELRAKPRPHTDVEVGLLAYRALQLDHIYDQVLEDYNNGKGSKAEIERSVAALKDLFEITESSGTETGRGLSARQIMVNQSYTLGRMTAQTQAAKGEKLTTEEHIEIKERADSIKTKKKEFEDHTATAAEAVAEKDSTKEIKKVIRRNRRVSKKVKDQKKSLIDEITLIANQGDDSALPTAC